MISDDSLARLLGSRTAAALIGDLVRATILIVMSMATLFKVAYYWLVLLPVLERLHFNDFGKFYYSTRLFERGENMYGDSPATAIPIFDKGTFQFLDMNPPHLHVLLLPLTRLPIDGAFAVWAVAGLACLVASLLIIARELRLHWTPAGTLWTIFAASVFAATDATVVTGQLTFLLLLSVTLAWRAARRNDWQRSSLYLGLLMSVKPFFGVFVLYALWTRRWKAAMVTAAAAAAIVALGLLTFGMRPYIDWLHALGAVSWQWAPMNGSLLGLFSKAFDGGPVFTPVFNAPDLVRPLAVAASLGLVATTFAVLRRDHSPDATDRAFLALTLLAVLVSPLGWAYYLWLAAPPAAAIWISSRQRPSVYRNALVLLALPGLFLPVIASAQWSTAVWSGVTIGSAYTWTTLLLWAATMADGRLQQTTTARSSRSVAGASAS